MKSSKANPQSKGRRKKKVKSPSKAVYREHQAIRRLLRYIDRHRVEGLLDGTGVEKFPRVFLASAEGREAVKVTVDWLGVKAGLENAIDILTTGRSDHLTAERLAEVKRFRSIQAAFYVLEFLPEAIDSALSNLYVEAFTKISVEQGRPGARTGVEILASMDYEELTLTTNQSAPSTEGGLATSMTTCAIRQTRPTPNEQRAHHWRLQLSI